MIYKNRQWAGIDPCTVICQPLKIMTSDHYECWQKNRKYIRRESPEVDSNIHEKKINGKCGTLIQREKRWILSI